MAITPIDLTGKEFGRRVRGYDPAEVDRFMKEAADELEQMLSEKARLEDELKSLSADLRRYRDIEATLNNALVLAQKTAEELRANAEKEADLIIRAAREKSGADLGQARNELEELRSAKTRFMLEFRALLRSHLELCEGGNCGGSAEQPAAD